MTFGLLWEKSRSSSYRSQVGKSPGRKPRSQTPHAVSLRTASSKSVCHQRGKVWEAMHLGLSEEVTGTVSDKAAFQSTAQPSARHILATKYVFSRSVLQVLEKA